VATRRNRGEGGIHWDETRRRWIGTVTVGYDSRGKRRTRRFSSETRTEANRQLKELLREGDLGLDVTQGEVTVEATVEAWLANGLHGR